MGEILGLGITHQPTISAKELRPRSFIRALEDPDLPPELRDPNKWTSKLQEEWADDEGRAAGVVHRNTLIEQFKIVRAALDRFAPDLVIIWGDDQYERIREDLVPPFCFVNQEEYLLKPWQQFGSPNVWGEPVEATFKVLGNRRAGNQLVEGLLDLNFDMSYSYESQRGLGHAFVNTVLYLDWERDGWNYAILPCLVNCYGRRLVSSHGYWLPLGSEHSDATLDPPCPTPARCYQLGAAIGELARKTDLRIALIASSSWSHAFLTRKTYHLYPDTDADMALYDALDQGNYSVWRSVERETIEASGQHELLNWFCLVGAIDALGLRKTHLSYVASHLYNSGKAFAIFETPVSLVFGYRVASGPQSVNDQGNC